MRATLTPPRAHARHGQGHEEQALGLRAAGVAEGRGRAPGPCEDSRTYGLRSCHAREIKGGNGPVGTARISFMIQPNGRTSNVSVVAKLTARLKKCMKDKVKRWRLGKVPKQVFVNYGVRFTLVS